MNPLPLPPILLHFIFVIPVSTTLTPPASSTLTPPCPEWCQCADTTVICSGQALNIVPQHLPLNTTVLDLSHNRLRDGCWQDIDSLITSLPSLNLVRLNDNIFTSLPREYQNVKIDISENPLHCDCPTLELPSYDFLLDPEAVKCASTSNPDINDVYLFSLSRNTLRCDDRDLMVPAEVTLYKTSSRQEISCSKPQHGTVYWYRYGELLYKTGNVDCSLSIRYMSSRKTGMYEVRYETPFDNTTLYVKVKLEEESYLPVIDVTHTVVEVPFRGTSKLTCSATGIPPPTIEWFFEGSSLTEIIEEDLLLVDERTVFVSDVTVERVFTCRASNFVGYTEANFVVRPVDTLSNRGAVFEWLAPLSVVLLVLTGAGSAAYYFYSKHRLAVLKQRCTSPAVSSTAGTIFENSEAYPSTILEGDGYKMITVSTSSPPHQFICPITRDCMKNPVVASDGFSYEEKAILAWFKRNGTSPMTNGEINKRLIQNHNLRTLITDIMEKTPASDSFVNIHHLTHVNPHTPAETQSTTSSPHHPNSHPGSSSPHHPITSSGNPHSSGTSSPHPTSSSSEVGRPSSSRHSSPRPSSSSSSSHISSSSIRGRRVTAPSSGRSLGDVTRSSLRRPGSTTRRNTPRSAVTMSAPSLEVDSSVAVDSSVVNSSISNADETTDTAAELSNVSLTDQSDEVTSPDVTSSQSYITARDDDDSDVNVIRTQDEQTISSGIGSSTSLDINIMEQDVIETAFSVFPPRALLAEE